jgi:hypothetical protein
MRLIDADELIAKLNRREKAYSEEAAKALTPYGHRGATLQAITMHEAAEIVKRCARAETDGCDEAAEPIDQDGLAPATKAFIEFGAQGETYD